MQAKTHRQYKRLSRQQKRQFKRLKRRGPIARFLKGIIRFFKKRPEIVNLSGGELKDKAIYIANHNAASGPITYEAYFPKLLTPWGAHQMCGSYKERWNYLYRIFYRQKLKYGKFKSWMLATVFAVFSKKVYMCVGLIPTYHDARLIKSIRHSIEILNYGYGILIFPENSDDGYKEVLEEYNRGFVTLSKLFYKLHGEDLPVYNVYYCKQHAKIVIGRPFFLNKMLGEGVTEHGIAKLMTEKTNALYAEHIQVKGEK